MFTGMQRPEVSIRFLSQLLSTLILRRGLSLNWRLLILAGPTREQALRILLSLPFHYYNDGCTLMSLAFLHGYWRSNRLPSLHDRILPTEPSSRLHTFILRQNLKKCTGRFIIFLPQSLRIINWSQQASFSLLFLILYVNVLVIPK